MTGTKLVWSWTEWSDHDVANVWLPKLHLSRLPGKTTLYVAGHFTAFDPPRLTDLARDVIEIIWAVGDTSTATVEWAPASQDRPERADTYTSCGALVERLSGLFACDENYIVRLGPFTFAEQDGDMLDIEASRPELQRLFDALQSHATDAGWTFIDVVDD